MKKQYQTKQSFELMNDKIVYHYIN